MAIPLSVWLGCLFLVMPCAMAVTLIYTFAIAGSPFTSELLSPWMATTILDFYINVVPLATWICYKEAKPINSTIWVILVVIFGSTATGFYIFIQLLNLSSEETLQDPVYHVLLRHQKKDDVYAKKKLSPVITARIAFSALGCLMLGTLIYTLVTDGSPFRKELLTPWMTALLVDFYCHVVILSIWVAYKESSWITAFVWIVLLICFGSITTCAYIAKHVFQLSSEDPLFVVLLNNSNRFEPWVRSVIATVFDPFRADVVIFVGEKKPALEGVLERMKQSPEGRDSVGKSTLKVIECTQLGIV